jgi:hypothetical protein
MGCAVSVAQSDSTASSRSRAGYTAVLAHSLEDRAQYVARALFNYSPPPPSPGQENQDDEDDNGHDLTFVAGDSIVRDLHHLLLYCIT